MLTTLGKLALGDFQKAKPLFLLVYLLMEGPTLRQTLRALLWPTARQADASLRVALHLLNKYDPQAVHGNELLHSDLRCDATRLLSLRGEAALAAYTGPFLHGAPVAEVSPEFEEWVESYRVRLALHVQGEALTLAENSAPDAAAQLAERAYRLPGAPPPDPEVLSRVLALTSPGSPLETEVRAELFGLTGAGQRASSPVKQPRRMLGRATELDTLLAWALSASAWLALVSGPGGIGKSTLARELLRELSLTKSSVTLVDAEGTTRAGDLLLRLAAARVPGQMVQDSWAGLGPALGAAPVILFDGVDDLVDLPDLLVTLKSELPQARWVLTGRRYLGRLVQDEAGRAGLPGAVLTLPLVGLEVPSPDAELSEIAASSAVGLFVREATRVRRDFQLHSGNALLIASLTRRLMGHPLALALAASWLRVEDLEAVHTRVLQDAASLVSPGGDGDGRRGLMLVAERSWDLLSPSEQEAALRLTAAPDFDPVDAPALGVPGSLLDALLEHSFLETYQPGSERLRLAPALTGLLHLKAQAQPALTGDATARHAFHYLSWFTAQAPEAPEVDAERGNLHQAMLHALGAGTLTAPTVDHLMAHYDRRGLHVTGTDVFAGLSDEAEQAGAPVSVQAALQIACMWLASRAGRLLDAQTLAARFLQGPLAADPASRMKVLNTLAGVRSVQGQWRAAVELFRQAILLSQQTADRTREGLYRTNLLANLLYWADQTEVEKELRTLETLLPELPEHLRWQVRQRLLTARIQFPGADLVALSEEAQAILNRGEQSLDATMTIVGLTEWSRIHLLRGHLREAEALMSRLRVTIQRSEQSEAETDLAILETQWSYAKGQTPKARRSAQRALDLSKSHGNPWELVEILLITAPDLQMLGARELRNHLAAVTVDDQIMASQRQRAAALLGEGNAAASPLDLRALRAWLVQTLRQP